jgi:3',5'-cyclic AMP phosphodiesterase CpdA
MAPSPFLLLQLSDLHIGADPSEVDPVASLRAAVEAVQALPDRPDALLVSGDLSDDGSASSYERAAELLAPLGLPTHVLPGNHDDRAALRRAFGLAGDGAEPVNYSADLGPLRLIALDSTLPGHDRGELSEETLRWLDAELRQEPTQPTVLAMHHPPLVTAVPPFDEICLSAAERDELAALLERHPQVRRVVCGHIHRTIAAELGGRAVLVIPSVYRQAVLDFGATEFALSADPAGFAVHAWTGEALASHVQPIPAQAPA